MKKNQTFLSVDSVTKKFNTPEGEITVLRSVDFSIGQGEVVAIVGPSGSGKTTLLNCIAGIDLPSSGKITINGTEITQLTGDERASFRGSTISFIFQDFLLLEHLNVEENILLPIELHGVSPRYTVDEILEKVGLLAKKKSPISVLSRGERQRVAIARAFIGKIPFLIADEPTGNLDVNNATKVMEMMLDIARELSVTVLLVTHDPEIYKRAQRVIQVNGKPL